MGWIGNLDSALDSGGVGDGETRRVRDCLQCEAAHARRNMAIPVVGFPTELARSALSGDCLALSHCGATSFACRAVGERRAGCRHCESLTGAAASGPTLCAVRRLRARE